MTNEWPRAVIPSFDKPTGVRPAKSLKGKSCTHPKFGLDGEARKHDRFPRSARLVSLRRRKIRVERAIGISARGKYAAAPIRAYDNFATLLHAERAAPAGRRRTQRRRSHLQIRLLIEEIRPAASGLHRDSRRARPSTADPARLFAISTKLSILPGRPWATLGYPPQPPQRTRTGDYVRNYKLA